MNNEFEGPLITRSQAAAAWIYASRLVVMGLDNTQTVKLLEEAEGEARNVVREIPRGDFLHVKYEGMNHCLRSTIDALEAFPKVEHDRETLPSPKREALVKKAAIVVTDFGGLAAAGLTEDRWMELAGQPFNPRVGRLESRGIRLAKCAAG